MPSLLDVFMNKDNQLDERSIANEMLMGSKLAAQAYLIAILETATPELKAMLSNNFNQIIAAHSAMTELSINRGWYKPYDAPVQQLAETFKNSMSFVGQEADYQ